MENETKKTESGTTEKQESANATDPQANMIESIMKFVNQPAVASAGLGIALYFLFDPKGLKATLQDIRAEMHEMRKLIGEQSETILSLKKQVIRVRKKVEGEDGENPKEENLNGYRKSKGKTSAFLD